MKDDFFIAIPLLLTCLVFIASLLFGCGVYLLAYLKKKPIADKFSYSLTSVQPFLLLFVSAIFLTSTVLSTLYYSKYLILTPLSYPAKKIVPLFTVTAIVTSIAFFITQMFLFYFAFRYRTRPNRKSIFLFRNAL